MSTKWSLERKQVPTSSAAQSRNTNSLIRLHIPQLKPHEVKLAFFYSSVMGLILILVWKELVASPKIEFFIATLWIGFLLAISFMEAWVKFKAPLLQRHIAVDVGRHIFEALNVVEFILMITLWCLQFNGAFNSVLAIASTILCLEIIIVTPVLSNLAKFRIIQSIGEDDKQVALVSQLKEDVSGLAVAKPYWHFIYIGH